MVKVAVFGAGMAGLSAAHELRKVPDFEVDVYERSDHIGGKSSNQYGGSLPSGTDGHGHGITLDTGPLRLGEHVLAERPRVHVMDHPLMAVLGLADGPSMLLGTDLLAGQVVTLSYGRDRVWVEDSEG